MSQHALKQADCKMVFPVSVDAKNVKKNPLGNTGAAVQNSGKFLWPTVYILFTTLTPSIDDRCLAV